MRGRRCIAGTLIMLLVVPCISWSQFGTHKLPSSTPITGIDFYDAEHGLITTSDSLVYAVDVDFENDSVRIAPVNVLGDTYPSYLSSIKKPVWINDSTVFISTFEGIGGDKYIKMSQDSGRTWTIVEHISGLDQFGEVYTVDDSLLLYAITGDLTGFIGFHRLDYNGQYLTGNSFDYIYSGIFTPLNSDTVVFSTYSDSLAYYSLSEEEVWYLETDRTRPDQYSLLFDLLESGGNDVLIASSPTALNEPDSLFRSTDGGHTWSFVLEGNQFTSFSNTGILWIADVTDTNLTVYQSRDYWEPGTQWYSVLAPIPYGSAFTASSSTYFWVGTDSGEVSHIWYNPNRIDEPAPHSMPKSIVLRTYPNPFNNTVTIRLQNITPEMPVSVEIYNLLGQRVATLYDEIPHSETLQLQWETNGIEVGSGVYFVRAQSTNRNQTRKLMLIE